MEGKVAQNCTVLASSPQLLAGRVHRQISNTRPRVAENCTACAGLDGDAVENAISNAVMSNNWPSEIEYATVLTWRGTEESMRKDIEQAD